MKEILQILLILIIFSIINGCNSNQSYIDLDNRIEKQLDIYFEYGQLSGNVLVIKNSNEVLNKSFGISNYKKQIKNNKETQFYIASITKQFTAYAILLLVEEGKLNLNNYIGEFVDSLPPHIHYLTIEQLLSHTSGIPDWFPYGIYKQGLTNQDVINWLVDSELKYRPGYQFNYSNAGYILLAELIKNISGLSYSEFLKENIFDAYGLKNTFVFDKNSHKANNLALGYNHLNELYDYELLTVGAGGIYSTCEDLNIWHKHLLKSATANNTLFSNLFYPKENDKGFTPPIGYGWAELKKFNNYLIANGALSGFRSLFIRNIKSDIAIIILTNRTCAKITEIGIDVLKIIEGQDIDPPEPPIKKVEVILQRSKLESCIGRYDFDGYPIDIFITNDTLFYKEPGMSKNSLYALNDSCFFMKSFEISCCFHKDSLLTIENGNEKYTGRRIKADNILYK